VKSDLVLTHHPMHDRSLSPCSPRPSPPSLLYFHMFRRRRCFWQGHVFCFAYIFVWAKKIPARSPTRRMQFSKVIKTLTPEDIAKEDKRLEVRSSPALKLLLPLPLWVFPHYKPSRFIVSPDRPPSRYLRQADLLVVLFKASILASSCRTVSSVLSPIVLFVRRPL